MKITKTLCLLALLCCAPATVVMTGCSGGSSSIPLASIPGTYTGTYGVVSGPDANDTGPLQLTIASDGTITGSVTNSGVTLPFSGTANLSTGAFTLTGIFNDVNGTASGTLRNSDGGLLGVATFTLSNNDVGNVTFSKGTPL